MCFTNILVQLSGRAYICHITHYTYHPILIHCTHTTLIHTTHTHMYIYIYKHTHVPQIYHTYAVTHSTYIHTTYLKHKDTRKENTPIDTTLVSIILISSPEALLIIHSAVSPSVQWVTPTRLAGQQSCLLLAAKLIPRIEPIKSVGRLRGTVIISQKVWSNEVPDWLLFLLAPGCWRRLRCRHRAGGEPFFPHRLASAQNKSQKCKLRGKSQSCMAYGKGIEV